MAETIHVRGEGGIVWEIDLPLPHGFAHRLKTGALVQVDRDGNTVEPAEPEGLDADELDGEEDGEDEDLEENEDLDGEEDEDPADPDAVPRPAVFARKQEWVTYAVSQGATVDDAKAMTKPELIELYGG